MTQPSAKIIADSISEQGHRIVTMEVVMHRFVLAEFNTHRVFSRNSASSRAIPVRKIIDRVQDDPAYPVHWGAERRGMQSGDILDDATIQFCKDEWDLARVHAIVQASNLASRGLHKSLVNRLLEPFMWHTAIVTSTEWANFFNQRCDPAAQPETKAVADAMQLAYYRSTPIDLSHGQWHTPYLHTSDEYDIIRAYPNQSVATITEVFKKVSTARCARVSYLTHGGVRDFKLDLDLFDKLHGNGHWSPFEHVASPVMPGTMDEYCGNFVGWKQFRKEFPNENRVSFIPNLPELQESASDTRTTV